MPSTHPYDPIRCATGGNCGEAPEHPIHFVMTVITADGTFPGRITEEDVVEVAPEYVQLTPNYENTIKFLAEVICDGSHEDPYLAMWSVLDQFRYLMETDKPAALRVVRYFQQKTKYREEVGGEDAHLEADYEDRSGYPELD